MQSSINSESADRGIPFMHLLLIVILSIQALSKTYFSTLATAHECQLL
jgi:hypothetical protein